MYRPVCAMLTGPGRPMRLAHEIRLRVRMGVDEPDAPNSEVLVGRRATGRVVRGAILEAAVEWNQHIVLLASDGVDFDDALHIHLLDARIQLLDTAQIGMVSVGTGFSNLVFKEPDTLEFAFASPERWRVTLFRQRRPRIPWIGEPMAVSRPFGFSRRFGIARL